MPLSIDEDRASFAVSGPEWLPRGWAARPESAIRRARNRLGELLVRAKRRELQRGIDADGAKFAPVKAPRPDGATGPPLSPHYGMSRLRRNVAFAVNKAGVTIFWRGFARKLAGWHTFKQGPRALPVRKVVGLSPAEQRRVRREIADWGRNVDRTARTPEPKPAPKPPPPPQTPRPPSRGRVAYLGPGERPRAISRRIQVTGG